MTRHLPSLIPELPPSFGLIEGELTQGPTVLTLRARLRRQTVIVPLKHVAEFEGAPLYVGWVSVTGWTGPKVAVWSR